ncbi:MAG: phage tail sheath family protein [Sporomusaceae bacterium]|nr:phage tail sheath family protein [Sporomusaceae bacterium]
MAYKHGVYASEIPTSILPPVRTSAGLPVVFGTAPVNLATAPAAVNTPVLCYTYAEAVAALGYSDDWANYTLCEFMNSHFSLFGVAPVVFVNVLDSATHKTAVTNSAAVLVAGQKTLTDLGILLSSLVVKLTEAGQPLIKNTDYTAAFDDDGKVLITRIADGAITTDTTSLVVTYDKLDPSAVDKDDIIGGIDGTTGAPEGLELVNKVFPLFRLVPGMILAPGWSHDPEVEAVMKAKAGNINSHFKAIAVVDIDSTSTGADLYSEVPAWKTTNNYVDPLEIACWPQVKLSTKQYHLSTQLAGIMCKTDAANDDIPYVSPSNKSLQANGAVLADGTEVSLGPEQAAYLNGEGIVTALNFIGGWKAWGNRTGCYPGVTDPKDAFIPIKRMFNWIANTLILTYWQKVDNPMNRRLVETVTDSNNIWLNGLAARGIILGGRVAVLAEENPTTDLMDGIIRFHVYVTPPGPAREIDFILEYDPAYLATLFGE